MEGYGDVSLPDLEKFQAELLRLSQVLDECYQTISRSLQITSQHWRDTKHAEFEQSFRRYREEVRHISEEYREWGSGYLQTEINNIRNYDNTVSVE